MGYGENVGEGTFMEGSVSNARRVNKISCSTGWGSSGEWLFPNLKKEKKKVKVETPDKYDYNLIGNVSSLNSILLSVKASNDAHVALNSTDGKLWEIVIGGWGNGRSCIRGAS